MDMTTIDIFDSRIVRIPYSFFPKNEVDWKEKESDVIRELSEMFGPSWSVGKIEDNNIESAVQVQFIRQKYTVVFEMR
jgi:hypothetical protein